MLRLEQTVAVLLCGGQSQRFGPDDKLLYPFLARPLVAHAAQMLASLPFAARIATVQADALTLQTLLTELGYQLVPISERADQQASLKAGLSAALQMHPEAICLSLGDMPLVPSDHILALAHAASVNTPAVSWNGGPSSPPWIAASDWVGTHRDALKAALRRDAIKVAAPSAQLRDFDTLDDLKAIEARKWIDPTDDAG